MPLDTLILWNQQMIQHGEMVVRPSKLATRRISPSQGTQKLIFTDASNVGWGAHLDQDSTGGPWPPSEKHLHVKLL